MRVALPVLTLVLGSAAPALGGFSTYGVNAGATSTTLFGGDRRLDTMGFQGTSDVYTNDNFLTFVDGALKTNNGTYGWNDAAPRDMSTAGNTWFGNPDRADNASSFAGEGGGTGTIGEVFGAFGSGYKNMSWIVDGEGSHWTLDLLFAADSVLAIDDDPLTVELALLERGGNSDINVYGIRTDGTLTSSLFVSRNMMKSAGWSVDTLEIDGLQTVHGVGISLDQAWGELRGFRIEALSSFDGPDLVAVGTAMPVPGPAVSALIAMAGLVGRPRRRK